jgi:GDP-mannose 6-dehydrogenase
MGYVGCVTAAVLAREGHSVTGVDSNPTKVEMLTRGESPVIESGLPELIRRTSFAGRLTAATEPSLETADIIVICVGTPSAAHGGLETRFIERVAEQIGAGIADHPGYPVVVMRSTALPEIIEELLLPTLEQRSGKRAGTGFGLAVNPEFLREGSSLEDFDHPQFTLIGADDSRSAATVERLYSFLRKAPTIVTDRRTAALIKYASNAFHAMKVAFANEIGAISKAVGVDGREVMRIFCLDHKLNLSAAYLKPGMPFGGSCLPKDVRALLYHGRRHDVPLQLLGAVMDSNRMHTEACVQTILANGWVRVGVFGLAFKAGTDDLRESPGVEIIEKLLGKGRQISVYDRRVSLSNLVGANRDYLLQHLPHVASLLRESVEEVIAQSDVLVTCARDETFEMIPSLMGPEQVLIDLVGITDQRGAGRARYQGIAW